VYYRQDSRQVMFVEYDKSNGEVA